MERNDDNDWKSLLPAGSSGPNASRKRRTRMQGDGPLLSLVSRRVLLLGALPLLRGAGRLCPILRLWIRRLLRIQQGNSPGNPGFLPHFDEDEHEEVH